MKALQVDQKNIPELSGKGIVVCSGYDTTGNLISYIGYDHKQEYPLLMEVEITTEDDLRQKLADQDAVITELLIKLNDKGIIP